jgi:SH3 domain-containing YSC84-like protein 1
MKKLILLWLTALVALSARSTYASERTDYVKHIETCEAILQEFMDDAAYAIPPQVLQRAHGLVILNQFKAGFIFGATGGYGVIMAKRPDGSWSIPVLLHCGGIDFGLQAGGRSIESIFVLTDDETPRRLFSDRINVGVDAKAVAGPHWTELESVNKEILATPVLVYTKTKGLYAGATIKTGYIARDDEANRNFYRTPYTLPELLYGNFVTPPDEVKPLMNYVKKIAP